MSNKKKVKLPEDDSHSHRTLANVNTSRVISIYQDGNRESWSVLETSCRGKKGNFLRSLFLVNVISVRDLVVEKGECVRTENVEHGFNQSSTTRAGKTGRTAGGF